MAEKIVSPGVFTNEKDLSFLPAGIAQIGGAFIGPTVKGPAYVPIALDSFTDFERVFGKTNPNLYLPFSVKEYIQNGGKATIVRTMYDSGYTATKGLIGVYATDTTNAVDITNLYTYNVKTTDATDVTAAGATLTYGASTYKTLAIATGSGEKLTTDYLNGLTYSTGSTTFTSLTKLGNAFISSSGGTGYIAIIVTGSDVSTAAGSSYSSRLKTRYTGSGAANVDTLLFTLHATEKIDGDSYYDGTTGLFEYASVSEVTEDEKFGIRISGSALSNNATAIYTASLSKTSNDFISKIFAQSPSTQDDYVYLYTNFATQANSLFNSNEITEFSIKVDTIKFAGDRTERNSGAGHTYASTPWVLSQTANNTNYPLFKFNTLSEGTNANYEVKVGISNIRAAGTVPGTSYGDFTVIVRYVDQSKITASPFDTIDSDLRPNIIETFTQCNLDPTSKNYIGRKIGDRYQYYDTINGRTVLEGDYPNKSKYIRVEIDDRVKDGAYSPDLVPFGHKSLTVPMSASFHAGTYTVPNATIKSTQTDANGVYSKKIYFGFDYDFASNDNLNYLKPLPAGSGTGSNAVFLLSNYSQDASATAAGYTGSIDLTSNTSIETRKFILPFQAGFDGIYPNRRKNTGTDISATNAQGYNFSTPSAVTSDGYIQYKKAIDSVGSPTSVDINLLTMPGVIYQYHPEIISYAEQVAQDRGDTFFVFDATKLDATPQETVDEIADWDSNYAATYYPWVKVIEPTTNRPIWVPPSVIIPGVLAFNDKVGEQWFAPAGLNRGGLAVNDVYVRLNRTDIDTLYDGRVNPIATIPNIGFAVWGQKTLQAKPSALDRINVRRLLIALKKFIASASQYLVFEQNTSATRNRFLNIVNPYMESVQQRQGLYAFKVVMDDTNNTPDLIDRNIMYGQIYLQPARTAEFIIIDFNILPTGATFGA